MTVLRESPWYQEILQEGRKGGIQEGRYEGELSLTLRQLARRFGSIAPDLETQIRNLSLEQLESLGEALLDFSEPTDLVSWLQQHRST